MRDKEQIIIDGKKEKVNILFECNHVNEVQAYKMIENGIEINPENAPICNFKIKIVSNTKSPYGFYTIFQKDPKKDVWEYSGFGNSGACSIVTALLKQLTRKTQECEKLSILAQEESARNGYVEYELNDKLKQKTQECENLKAEEKYLKQCCAKAGEELAKHSFEYDGKEKNLVVQAMELNEKYEKLEKTLEEIEEELKEDVYCESQECGCDDYEECLRCTKNIILDIINEAKGEENVK